MIKGSHHTEEAKRKMRLAHLGKTCVFSENHRKNLSDAMIGNKNQEKRRSEGTRQKIREARLGMRFSEEHKRNISESHKGHHHSPETMRKIINANRNRLKKNTPIEIAIQRELDSRNINYQTHLSVCDVCIPDIVFPELKVAVFADGDYWHSKSFKNGKVWERDRRQDQVLRENGWIPLRFWGHEINDNVINCVDRITNILGVDLFE